MTTTIIRNLKGSEMNYLFEKSKSLNIRHFRLINEVRLYKASAFYDFTINIRHDENVNPTTLFDSELDEKRKFKKTLA